jgi:hypothetical protein
LTFKSKSLKIINCNHSGSSLIGLGHYTFSYQRLVPIYGFCSSSTGELFIDFDRATQEISSEI